MLGLLITNLFYAPLLLSAGALFIFIGLAIIVINLLSSLSSSSKTIDVSTSHFKALFDHLEDGVCIYTPELRILECNDAFARMVAIPPEILHAAFIVKPEFAQKEGYRVLASLMFPSLVPSLTEESEPGVWPNIISFSLENPSRSFLTTLHQLKNSEGALVGFLKIIREKTREDALLKSKTEFIHTAAHQLRTPLTGLHWALQTIMKTAEEKCPELNETTREAFLVSERALKIVNDLLDAARIEEGKFGGALSALNLSTLVENVLKEIKPLKDHYGIAITYNPPSSPIIIKADEERLAMVINNLLDNAIRYNTKDGSVIISLQEEGTRAQLVIQDTGVGIPENDKAHIFDKLYRGSNVAQLEPNGSGLGLYIAKIL